MIRLTAEPFSCESRFVDKNEEEKEIIRRHYQRLGRIMTDAKREALSRNRILAREAHAAPWADMESAYLLWKSGKTTLSRAARDHAMCSYGRMKKYTERRNKGETAAQIKAKP